MRKLVLVTTLFILLSSCNEKKESCYSDFTYSKANIRMSHLLKFNSSDTVYYQDRYPFGNEGLYYFLLEQKEKKTLDSLVCQFTFPKDSVLINNKAVDGVTIAFSIENKRVMLHDNEGPKEFWKFEEWIDKVQLYKQLKPINRKIEFDKFDKMLSIPQSPIIK